MTIIYQNFFGTASIGVYSLATEKMAMVPLQVSKNKIEMLEQCLKVKIIHTTVGESVLIGALASANSHGIVLPHFTTEEEIKAIKSDSADINIGIMETKRTAYGNTILTNDYGAIVDPGFKGKDISRIVETLGVEVVGGEIAGLPYVGSLAIATNKGVLAHPLLKEDERKLLENVLKVPVDVGTVNRGIPYVATGLIGNTHGAVAGDITTGPELFIIGNSLNLVKI